MKRHEDTPMPMNIMKLPTTTSDEFLWLAVHLENMQHGGMQLGVLHLREMMLAQWAVESGWGKSRLAREYNNFAGMKWRDFMKEHATKKWYKANDGGSFYCYFATQADFIRGFVHRLDKHPMYAGWREKSTTPEGFIQFIGPIWVGLDAKRNAEYVRKVMRVYNDRTKGTITL